MEEKHLVHTFPESPEPFLSGNGLIGINSALVSPAASSSGLSLEPDLYHICGLSHSHSQGTCGAACQKAAPDAGICGRKWGSVASWAHTHFMPLLTRATMSCNLLPFGNRFQTSSCSKNSLRQTNVTASYLLGTRT